MPENLALVYQEVFTVVDRLRGGRQTVLDAAAFRQQIRDALQMAEQRSRAQGYSAEEIRLATFAVVALLDATVLSLQNPVFHDWPKKPLQEELFGSFNAGEIFFINIQRLLAQPDSKALADVLEVHQLCLLLGFQGRHSLDAHGELGVVRQTLARKIRELRGEQEELSPAWKPLETVKHRAIDQWLQRFVWISAVLATLAVVLFLIYKFTLQSGISDLAKLAGGT